MFFLNSHHFIIVSDLPRIFSLKSPLASTIFIYLKLRNQSILKITVPSKLGLLTINLVVLRSFGVGWGEKCDDLEDKIN